jgi:hypothetical protein
MMKEPNRPIGHVDKQVTSGKDSLSAIHFSYNFAITFSDFIARANSCQEVRL